MKTFALVPALLLLAVSPLALSQEPEIASDDTGATVVFLRHSFVGSGIKASVYEITGEERVFIGIMKNKNRLEYRTTPGNHLFMVVSEAADFMEANLEGGKTYYSIITPRTGAWKARFSLLPIRNDGTTKFNTGTKDFQKWIKKAQTVSKTAENDAWYEKHGDSVAEKQQKYWPKWIEKPLGDKGQRTLNPQDGILTAEAP